MRSMFNLSHEHKFSTDMGMLVPVCCVEVLPGDTFVHSTSLLARVAPLAKPVMHRVELRIHHFYVPNRIVWSGFEKFITGEEATTIPVVSNATTKTLTDHLGVDTAYGGNVNALPVRAYNAIWNTYYRDQDLQAEVSPDNLALLRCCWEKDYLTVARPSPQQGAAQTIPFSLDASLPVYVQDTTARPHPVSLRITAGGPVYATDTTASTLRLRAGPSGGTGGINIDDLRRSLALQRMQEARALYGERYIDYLRYLGINPSDGRLNRPEYLGGGKQTINFSEVIAGAEGTEVNPGDLFGHGIAAARSRRYRRMFEEHGWVLSLMSARPKTVYQDGVPRQFFRSTAIDFWQKELEILPWQEVKTIEVHGTGSSATTFGYVPRYEEYRYQPSFVSGTFRKGTEEDWHLGREFASIPTLNGSFVECTPSDRIYQDTTMPELLVNARNQIMAMRLVRATTQVGAI